MPTLEVTRGPDAGRLYDIHADRGVIGRDPGCLVNLSDGRASRRHAELRWDDPDTCLLRDLGSSNGTLLNGRKLGKEEWARVADGAEIELGQTLLVFSLRGTVPVFAETADADKGETKALRFQVMETQSLPLLEEEAPEGAAAKVEALRFLLDLARTAESAERPEALATILAEGLSRAIDADRVLLFTARGEGLVPVERELPAHLRTIYRQPYSRTVVDEVARARMSILSSLPEDARFKDARSVAAGDITSAICVPLLAGEDLVGALYLDRLGGADPFEPSELELASAAGLQCSMALLNIRRLEELRAARDRLEAEIAGPEGFVGQSRALRPVYDFIERAAPTDAGVLILGESGTGKELVARALHRRSDRADRPFVIVNCAALAESLAEAELFGHERGAFTGADKARPGRFLAADGGSIFLDEIGELSEPIQAKLLRVLESGEITPVGEAGARHIDVRVIAATNRDLAAEAEAGRFRRDLYYRLNVLAVTLPPLRERDEDVVLLMEHFVRFFGERCGRPHLRIAEEVLARCRRYPWPGNVRELKNAVERMVILARGETLTVEDLPPELRGGGGLALEGSGLGGLRPLADVEKAHVLAVLEEVDGNKKRAAEVLGIDRSTLYAKLKQYDAEGRDAPPGP